MVYWSGATRPKLSDEQHFVVNSASSFPGIIYEELASEIEIGDFHAVFFSANINCFGKQQIGI